MHASGRVDDQVGQGREGGAKRRERGHADGLVPEAPRGADRGCHAVAGDGCKDLRRGAGGGR